MGSGLSFFSKRKKPLGKKENREKPSGKRKRLPRNPIPGAPGFTVFRMDENKQHKVPLHSGGRESGAPPSQPQQAQQKQPAAPKKDYGKSFRGVVRLAGKDLKGETPLRRAVVRVKGIGERLGAVLANIAISQMKLADDVVIGLLSEEQMSRLEDMLAHPRKYGVPSYLLNRQRDAETGEDIQLIGSDVGFYMRQDIERDKNLNTWRGFRHIYGQKVRGQHTRSTGRTGMTVGVLRKAVLAAKAGGAAEARTKEGGVLKTEKGAPVEKPREEARPAAGAGPKPAEKREEQKK